MNSNIVTKISGGFLLTEDDPVVCMMFQASYRIPVWHQFHFLFSWPAWKSILIAGMNHAASKPLSEYLPKNPYVKKKVEHQLKVYQLWLRAKLTDSPRCCPKSAPFPTHIYFSKRKTTVYKREVQRISRAWSDRSDLIHHARDQAHAHNIHPLVQDRTISQKHWAILPLFELSSCS